MKSIKDKDEINNHISIFQKGIVVFLDAGVTKTI